MCNPFYELLTINWQRVSSHRLIRISVRSIDLGLSTEKLNMARIAELLSRGKMGIKGR